MASFSVWTGLSLTESCKLLNGWV